MLASGPGANGGVPGMQARLLGPIITRRNRRASPRRHARRRRAEGQHEHTSCQPAYSRAYSFRAVWAAIQRSRMVSRQCMAIQPIHPIHYPYIPYIPYIIQQPYSPYIIHQTSPPLWELDIRSMNIRLYTHV